MKQPYEQIVTVSLDKHLTKCCTTVLLLLFLLLELSAQSLSNKRYLYEKIGVNQGLPTSEIYTVHQDQQGYIWAGTSSGASRFDGYEFKNYFQAGAQQIGLINDMVEEEDGTLWLGSKNGLFYFSDGEFQFVANSNDVILDLQFDRAGSLWIGGLGFVPFSIEAQQLQQLKTGGSLSAQSFTNEQIWKAQMGDLNTFTMDVDLDNNIYFGNERHLAYYDGMTLKQLWTRAEIARIDFIKAINPDSVFICGQSLVYRLVKNREAIPLMLDLFGGAYKNGDTTYFTGSSSTMYRHANNKLEYIATIDEESGYGDFWKRDLLLDRENNFWVATYDGVLLKLIPSAFTPYTSKEYPLLNANFCLAQSPDGQLLIGRHKGKILKKDGKEFDYYLPLPPNLPRMGGVRDIHYAKNGAIYLATELSGLFVYQDGEYKTYSKKDGLIDNSHFFLFEDTQGIVWSGSNSGVNKIVRNKNKELLFKGIVYTNQQQEEAFVGHYSSQQHPVFKNMIEDQYGNLWVASNQGLFQIRDDRLVAVELPAPFSKKPNLFDLEKDDLGNIWISSLGEGIGQIQSDTNGELSLIRQWTREDGLLSDVFLDLHIDKLNRLWMADLNGLCYLEEGKIHCFTKEDGWFDIASSHLKMLETSDSLLWTAGYTGLVSFPLYNIELNDKIPQPIIQSVELFDGKENIYQYAKGKHPKNELPRNLVLPHNKNLLRFHFSSSSQKHPSKNKFRFMLKGVDVDWQETQETRNIAYPNLAPNDYTFLLQASNNDGVWSEEISTFDFTIRSPWWLSPLAYLAYFCLLILALLFARRQIIQREQLKNRLEVEQLEKEKVQEIDQLRTRFFANISHEFRTPLTLIKAPLEDLLISRKDDAERLTFLQMHQNTDRLLQLVNQLLDLSKLESGVLRLQMETQDIYLFLQQLAGNFQSLAAQKQLHYKIYIPKHPLYLNFDLDKLEKIVLNLLSNAFKFTPKKEWIYIEADYTNQLRIRVGNKGLVIPPEEQLSIFDRFYQVGDTRHQGAGIGLALVRELVELQQGKIEVESSEEKGTWFFVALPLKRGEANPKLIPPSTVVAKSEKGLSPMENSFILEQKEKGISTKQNLLLIVEDHVEVRNYITSKLEKYYKIIVAENGQQGFEKAIEKIPDLIISDVMMPVMDGIQFCQKVKSDHRTDHIPVILLTAKADIESRLEGLTTGADDYLAKPFNSRELQVRCSNLIQQRQKLRERFQQGIRIAPTYLKFESAEAQFLSRAIAIVEEKMEESDFSIEEFAKLMQLSRTQLHRKLKAIANMSATDFVRNLRLERATQMLRQQSDSVSQIAYEVGFNNLSYFSKCFKEKYGVVPSEYMG